MSSKIPTVFVVAATGTQGTALCRQLRQLDWEVHATVRNPDTPAAKALAGLEITLGVGDWDDVAALTAGMAGCDMLSLTLTTDIANLELERIRAARILRIARAAGVRHVVYSSSVSAGAPEKRRLLPMDSLLAATLFCKNAIEGLVQRAGFEYWTILRPGFFMANLLEPKVRMYPDLLKTDTWTTALTADTNLNLIDPEDIAKFAVAAFRNPERFDKQGIELVGERLTPGEMMAVLSSQVGREIKAAFHGEEEVKALMTTNPMVVAQFALREGDKFADLDKTRSWGVPMGTFKDFIEREKAAVKKTYN